ncbi:alpha/beta fold hydrolase [Streptomyces sulphureus]|uniref:alpha/beta fold hydrolase n=1 Tax=Streptomyces sulphureus TaxID=47758 RepID=UPI00037E6EAC|nr:alpha/beta fold hydrolase [Streptomyces sulphureus]
MPYATAPDGTRIAYRTTGDGPPLVLLAGQAASHRWWDGVRADFETAHTVLTPDHRGTGASDSPQGPYSTHQFAQDVVAVLDHARLDSADVYGTSMGGRTAQWLAALHPHRVRRLVLGCTSPGGPHAARRDEAARRALTGGSAQAQLELLYNPEWLATHPAPEHTLGDPQMSPSARRAHFRASEEHDAWEVLPRITAPTLVVHGTEDLLNPTANAHHLAARIPHARLELLAGARHGYFEEFRETASPLVLDFLAEGR